MFYDMQAFFENIGLIMNTFFCFFGDYISFCTFANRNYSVIAKTKEVGIIKINMCRKCK
jgi:hypothetical protein